jgi:hypothetical protein
MVPSVLAHQMYREIHPPASASKNTSSHVSEIELPVSSLIPIQISYYRGYLVNS